MAQGHAKNYKTLFTLFELVGLALLVVDAVYLNSEGRDLGVALLILVTANLIIIVANICKFGLKNYEHKENV